MKADTPIRLKPDAASEGLLERAGELGRGLEPPAGILGQRAPEHSAKSREIAAGDVRECRRGLLANTGDAPPPQDLVNHRGQSEHVGSPVPSGPGGPFRRRVGPPHLRRHTDTLDSPRDPEAGQPRSFSRQQDVARVQHAVFDVERRGGVERASQLRGDAQRIGGR